VSDLHSSSETHSPETSTVPVEDILTSCEAGEPAPAREGLSPTFRMRADKHYVDFLDALPPSFNIELVPVRKIEPRGHDRAEPDPALVESIRRHGVLQPLIVQTRNGRFRLLAGEKRLAAAIAAGLRDVPCTSRQVDDEVARELAAAANLFVGEGDRASRKTTADAAGVEAGSELGRSLSALGLCANLLADPGSAFTQSVAANLMRAEIWRATCLLQALRVLRAEGPVSRKRVAVQGLVTRVLESVEPERRLRGVILNRQVNLSHSKIHADEQLLLCGLSGLLMATFGLVEGANAQVSVLARLDPGGDFNFSVTQDAVGPPPAWLALAREDASDYQPGGIGTVAILAARRIAEQADGRMTVTASGRGSEIHITIPNLP
jgi:hypothetical protein